MYKQYKKQYQPKKYETQVIANFTFMTLKDVVISRAYLTWLQKSTDQILITRR